MIIVFNNKCTDWAEPRTTKDKIKMRVMRKQELNNVGDIIIVDNKSFYKVGELFLFSEKEVNRCVDFATQHSNKEGFLVFLFNRVFDLSKEREVLKIFYEIVNLESVYTDESSFEYSYPTTCGSKVVEVFNASYKINSYVDGGGIKMTTGKITKL